MYLLYISLHNNMVLCSTNSPNHLFNINFTVFLIMLKLARKKGFGNILGSHLGLICSYN